MCATQFFRIWFNKPKVLQIPLKISFVGQNLFQNNRKVVYRYH